MLGTVTNADRASLAFSALEGFVVDTRVDDAEDAIADLLTDLLHLARARGFAPQALINRATAMMQEELEQDEEGDLQVGKLANFICTDADLADFFYTPGFTPEHQLFIRGNKINI